MDTNARSGRPYPDRLVALPAYFSATTLRSIAAQTGLDEGAVRAVARAAVLELHVGASAAAARAARMVIELASRCIGVLVLEAATDLEAELAARARAINPGVDLGPRREGARGVSVSLHSDVDADVRVTSTGWWAGFGGASLQAEDANPLGSALAGVLAFSEFFKRAYGPVLDALAPEPARGPGWSLLDWSCREALPVDVEPLPALAHAPAALVGCGAIGHAAAFVLGQLPGVRGDLDLVDPQTISMGNLQRYLGSSLADAEVGTHKVRLVAGRLAPAYTPRQFVYDWAGYRRRGAEPDIVLTALDSANDRRQVQLALPRIVVNAWTRLAECGLTTHLFDSNEQCLQCIYLPRTSAGAANDMQQIIMELGLDPVRVIHLLAGAPLTAPDLHAIEQRRGLASGALERWRGESVRPLFGHLCGMAEVRSGTAELYVVPLPHVSALAGLLLAAQLVHIAAGAAVGTRPIEVSVLRGPGDSWLLPPALKVSHPAPCICKDPTYVDRYKEKWAAG
jgi:hypothetical protein